MNGRGAPDLRLQRSSTGECQSQHGNRLPDPVDLFSEKRGISPAADLKRPIFGFQTAAMALKEDSVSIDDPKLWLPKTRAVILGHRRGTASPPQLIAGCDHTVMIPMAHGVDSLNGGSQRGGILGAGEISQDLTVFTSLYE